MYEQWLPELTALAARAGEAILRIYESDFAVQKKDDDSPLTQADLASHRVIVDGLARLTPDIPVLSEESDPPDFVTRRTWDRYWLIDPLDGTKEFINRNGEFTVNIALIVGHRAELGVVGVPARGVVYSGDVAAGQAQRVDLEAGSPPLQLRGRKWTGGRLGVVASRSHGGARLETYLGALETHFGSVERTAVGSSLKLCILAEGQADVYPRLGPTCEWDIAAAHALLSAAGGDLWAIGGEPLGYNLKESFLNPEFVAVSDRSFDWRSALPNAPA